MDKPLSEMTTEEIIAEIASLRERRAQRSEAAFSRTSKPSDTPRSKTARTRGVSEAFEDALSGAASLEDILEGGEEEA